MEITKDMLARNLEQAQIQLAGAMTAAPMEAGKQIGRSEGAVAILSQLLQVLDQPTPKAAEEPAADKPTAPKPAPAPARKPA